MSAEAQHFTDEYGNAAVRVPLANRPGEFALVEKHDYERLRRDGLTGPFYMNRGDGIEYVRTNVNGVSGGQVSVARAILGLGRGRVAGYWSRDRRDLRRSNLLERSGRAKRDDASEGARAAQAREAKRQSRAAAA